MLGSGCMPGRIGFANVPADRAPRRAGPPPARVGSAPAACRRSRLARVSHGRAPPAQRRRGDEHANIDRFARGHRRPSRTRHPSTGRRDGRRDCRAVAVHARARQPHRRISPSRAGGGNARGPMRGHTFPIVGVSAATGGGVLAAPSSASAASRPSSARPRGHDRQPGPASATGAPIVWPPLPIRRLRPISRRTARRSAPTARSAACPRR